MTTTIRRTIATIALVVMTAGCAMAAPAPKDSPRDIRPAAERRAPEHREPAPKAEPAPRAAAPAPQPAPVVVAPAPAPAPVVVAPEPAHVDGTDALLIGAGIAVGNALTDAILGD